jgi:hypothetical protein
MRRLVVLALLCALVTPVTSYASTLPQDDAGSGGDAPDVPTASFRIDPGTVYSGTIEGLFLGDGEDWYAFDAQAGQQLDGAVSSSLGCLYLHDANGAELAFTCSEGYLVGHATAVAPATGTYYVSYSYLQAHTYGFSVGVGAPAPNPAPVGSLDLFAEAGSVAPLAPATQTDDHVVIAVVDTGVNLYHDFFAAPGLTAHPSTWLPGFPASATTVSLALNEPTYGAAVTTDAATFAGMQRSTYDAGSGSFDTHLYTFPGTRVVGGVSFGEYEDALNTPVSQLPVLDDYGHGTHSAGLAGGANLAAADGNVLIVAVEVGSGTFEEGVRWAARQPWIDALTVSLGLRANLPVTTSPTGDRNGMEWATYEAFQTGKPVFMAAGNGVSNTGLAPDKCTTHTSSYTGPTWVTRIGAAEPADGSPTWWHCVPVDAVARTNVLSPDFDSLVAAGNASGTSAATPNAAGHFARLLLSGRRAGSAASRRTTADYLLHSAAPVATAAGAHDPSAYPLSLADQGYGLVDQSALNAARTRLLAASGPAPRPETAVWFENDAAVRAALWGPGSATAGSDPAPQDDAGSGRDAPNARADTVRVSPGVRYTGDAGGSDTSDWYAFDATAGGNVEVAVLGVDACIYLWAPSGADYVQATCNLVPNQPSRFTSPITESGTWHLHVIVFAPQTYAFGFGRNGPAPAL